MALPASGQISFRDFNLDRGVAPSSQVDLITAATLYGISYDTIGNDPTSMNEFYGAAVAFTTYTNCGRSNTLNGVCSDAANEGGRIFYSNCGPFEFGIGCVVYVDLIPTALIGYDYVQINSATWTINNSTGVITGLAEEQC